MRFLTGLAAMALALAVGAGPLAADAVRSPAGTGQSIVTGPAAAAVVTEQAAVVTEQASAADGVAADPATDLAVHGRVVARPMLARLARPVVAAPGPHGAPATPPFGQRAPPRL